MLILGSLLWTVTKGAPVVVSQGVIPSGGIPALPNVPRRKRTPEEVEKERQALGIIEKVAERQVETLSTDAQSQFEELERELELIGVHWEARYLELLSQRREQLVTEEIKRRIIDLQKENLEISIALLMTVL